MNVYVPGRDAVDDFALANGMPVNVARLALGLVVCCLVAPLSHAWSNPTTRHVSNIVLGVAIGWFVFDVNLIHSIVPTLATYGFVHFAPRALAGRLTAVVLFAHLIGAHIYREFFGADIMWDAAQMVLTLKLTGTAMSYGDGALPDGKKSLAIRTNQLVKAPSLLALCGYVYFFPTFLVGPIFEFNEYERWVHDRRVAPVGAILPKIGLLLVCIIGHGISEVYLPIAKMDTPAFYPDASFLQRLVLQLLACDFYKFRFYMVWQFGEVGGVLAGYGYDPTTQTWNGLQNNNLCIVEVPVNFRVAVNNWNMKVQKWLNTYIYQRVGLQDGKPTTLSTFSVFVASAAWHGLLPGYYVFFVTAGIGIEVGRHLRRRLRPYFHYTEDRQAHPWAIFLEFLDPKKASPLAILYDVGGLVVCWVTVYYSAPSFFWLDIPRCMQWWSTMYFAPHIALIVLLLGFTLLKPSSNAAKSKAA
ncbi:Aste57867_8671 [Aphanomyces stellatus]|uniref:Aste57867_8671 protein n=1 Tax=Aphanomyces stellatus TaxID=120398 RepID=A0A485KKX9_9STRA|nr:hypothetical protein As57867_008637 [Aphanomyces stellatus]VFT85557.1 Aste57867_8671 [Aphanomyces stellatus]